MESMDNLTMAFMARKFKNFKLKKNKPFRAQATPINAVKINGNLHRTPIMDRSMKVCDIDFMPCKITAISIVFNLPILSTAKCSHLYDVKTPAPTNVSSKAAPTKKKAMPFSKSQWVKRDVKNLVVDNLDVVDDTVT
ncbi:hypothetical protein ACET3Z_010524 [Daucus carota]